MLLTSTVFLHPDAVRRLYAIQRGKVVPVSDAINALKIDPVGMGQVDVAGRPNRYRIQRGEYTIIYEVFTDNRTIKVLWIDSSDASD